MVTLTPSATTGAAVFMVTVGVNTVALGVGAALGLFDIEGAVVLIITGGLVGARVGDRVSVIFGMDGAEVGSSIVKLLPTGLGAIVCALTVNINIMHCKRWHVIVFLKMDAI